MKHWFCLLTLLALLAIGTRLILTSPPPPDLGNASFEESYHGFGGIQLQLRGSTFTWYESNCLGSWIYPGVTRWTGGHSLTLTGLGWRRTFRVARWKRVCGLLDDRERGYHLNLCRPDPKHIAPTRAVVDPAKLSVEGVRLGADATGVAVLWGQSSFYPGHLQWSEDRSRVVAASAQSLELDDKPILNARSTEQDILATLGPGTRQDDVLVYDWPGTHLLVRIIQHHLLWVDLERTPQTALSKPRLRRRAQAVLR